MRPCLPRLLEYLEQILDPSRQAHISELYEKALNWEPVPRLPLVLSYALPSDFPFQPLPVKQTFDGPEKMLYNELVYAFNASIACRGQLDDDLPCTIRANFGTVIMASMFGGKIEQSGDSPPWVRQFETIGEFRRILDIDPLDFSKGWCPAVIETYEFYQRQLSDYPVLRESVQVVLPDLQGPLDTAELLRGSRIYEDFYEDEGTLSKVLNHIALAQVGFARHLQPLLNDGPTGYSHQHMAMIRGGILIRDDCAINISPTTYRQHIAPHDAFVLEAMGGGGIHCCGKFEHLVEEFLGLPGLKCIDLGQPELNEVDSIYRKARRRKIPLIRVRADEGQLISGRVVERFPTGVTLAHTAKSLGEAQLIMKAYKAASQVRNSTSS